MIFILTILFSLFLSTRGDFELCPDVRAHNFRIPLNKTITTIRLSSRAVRFFFVCFDFSQKINILKTLVSFFKINKCIFKKKTLN